ncbi:histidine kinase [Flavobacterium sp.]|uniref:histidine kinase n=1 Tax=Flavobacterium sp. TaxID=239 RepID=UPI0025F30CD1|nr:histidine kinase [Flavobacterium sp.]
MKFTFKEFVRSVLIGLIIFVIMVVLNLIYGEKIHFDRTLGEQFLYTMLYSVTLGYANQLVFIYLDKLFVNERFSSKRMIVGFFSSFVVTLIVIFLLRIFTVVLIEGNAFTNYFANENLANYVFAFVMTFIVVLSFYSFYIYKAYSDSKVKEQKIIAGTASAQFESLKNQIDPHFLFNSLNVLSSLIEENPENAQRFTTSLSKIYRYVLEQKDKQLVTVQEELAFAKTYMNLLKMRFENSITYDIASDFDNLHAKVVPLSLQLLLENTIKHNVASEQKPLRVKIYIEDGYLIVRNNLQMKDVLQDRRGVGLQNIVNRYRLLSERKVIIEEDTNFFKVKIPILTKQIAFMEKQNKYVQNTAYYRAKKRVEELKGFYGNLISYCCVIPLLVFINLRFSPQFQWFWFSAAGWGFGVIMHAFKVFGYSSNWEERKIKEILEKQTNTKQNWE